MKGQRKRNELISNDCGLGWSMIISIMLHVELYNYKHRVLGDKKWNTCSWICILYARSSLTPTKVTWLPLKTGAFHSQKTSLKQGNGGLRCHSQCSCGTENHKIAPCLRILLPSSPQEEFGLWTNAPGAKSWKPRPVYPTDHATRTLGCSYAPRHPA